jgi:hypothetical protein
MKELVLVAVADLQTLRRAAAERGLTTVHRQRGPTAL